MAQLTLPGFDLLGKIGQGGMATVWKARQLSLDRLVAIKVLSPRIAGNAADVERFHTECRTAAMLKHPGIVQVYDAMVHEGLYCLVMEYVAGESIGNRIRRKKRIPENEALFVLDHVSRALGHAWQTASLIHCDIKPDNILIDADGSVKVTDLGLATTIGALASLAPEDEVLGTPAYMSPEQIAGTPKLDCRTDIYSMGATLYQMLTGRMLFEGASDDEMLELQLKGHVPDALDLTPTLSSRICWLTEKMLARERDHRHPDWHAVTADTVRLMRRHPPAPPLPPDGVSVMQRSPRRQKVQAPPPTRTADAAIPVSTGPSPIRILLLLLILGALAATAFYLFSEFHRQPANVGPPPEILPRPPLPTPAAAPAAPALETRAAEMLDFARTWWKNNPDQYQEAITRFERVSRDAAGTRYALMALDDIRAVQQARQAAGQSLLAELRAKTGPLAAKGRFQEAVTLLTDYNGPLAVETAEARQAEAEALRQQETRHLALRQVREQERQAALAAILADLADRAVQLHLTNALALAIEAESRPALAPCRHDLKPIAEWFRRATSLDRNVLDSFKAQVGQEVTVRLLSGSATLRLSAVGPNTVQGDQAIPVDHGAAASIKITFSPADLAPAEWLARAGPETDPAIALLKGNAAALARNYPAARAAWAPIPSPFGDALRAALDRQEAAIQLVPPTPAPAAASAGTAPPVSAESLADQVMAANPGLSPKDLYFESDAQGRPVKAVCHSRALLNLEPFRAAADSLEALDLAQSGTANLAPLAAWPALKRLDLSDTPVADLTPLRELRLERLRVDRTRVKDLGPLRGMPLRELGIAGTRVYGFDALRSLSLWVFDASQTGFIESGLLKEMPLADLNLSGTRMFDFTALRRLTQLTSLQLEDTGFRDLALLADLPLQSLNLARTKVSDLAPLQRVTSLRHLNLANTTVQDLTPLRGLRLESLRLDQCRVQDLTPLAGMPLRAFFGNDTAVQDLTPLRNPALTELEIARTAVTDLAPMEGVPLERAVLSHTKAANLMPLARAPLKELRCEGMQPMHLAALRHAPLEILYFDFRMDPINRGLLNLFPNLRELNGMPIVRPDPLSAP